MTGTDAEFDEPAAPSPGARFLALTRKTLGFAIPLGLAVFLIVKGLPQITGVGWHAVQTASDRVSPGELVLMTALWWLGLSLQTLIQRVALPGLSYARALALNLSGSAVANLLPAGGAVAMGLNYAMIARWGIPVAGFAAYTLVINLVAMVTKLILPVTVVLVILMAHGGRISGNLQVATWLGTSGALLVIGLTMSRRCAAIGAAVLDRGLDLVAPLTRGRRWSEAAKAVSVLQSQAVTALAHNRLRLSAASATYVVSQALLLGMSLHAVDAGATWGLVLSAFAIERIATAVPITPGGSGFAEAGATAVLVAGGLDPAASATAVLIYRAYVTGAEIPLGGLVTLIWLALQRLRPPQPIIDPSAD